MPVCVIMPSAIYAVYAVELVCRSQLGILLADRKNEFERNQS